MPSPRSWVSLGQLASVYTYAGLTPRLSESTLDTLGTNQEWGLLPTHRLGSTLRRTSDGRLLIDRFTTTNGKAFCVHSIGTEKQIA